MYDKDCELTRALCHILLDFEVSYLKRNNRTNIELQFSLLVPPSSKSGVGNTKNKSPGWKSLK